MSEQFNIGDDVIVVNDQYIWLDPLPHDTILKVVNDSDSSQYVNDDEKTIEIQALRNWPDDFQVVSKLMHRTVRTISIVMIGDYVEVLVPLEGFAKDQTVEVGTVLKVVENKPGSWFVKEDTIEVGAMLNHRDKFKLVPTPKAKECATGGWLNGSQQLGLIGEAGCETIIPITRIESKQTVRSEDIGQPDILGVYRPQLETRKVGKVRVELVDKGFPNTLWALAELLTWAQETKGYKDHDWVNIPNALDALPAAASRHRVKHNKGMLYDEESGKLHKLHELFGVMAECELLLKNESDETLVSRIKQMCSTESK